MSRHRYISTWQEDISQFIVRIFQVIKAVTYGSGHWWYLARTNHELAEYNFALCVIDFEYNM